MFCECHAKVNPRQGARDLVDEILEISKARSKDDFLDELSDISYAVGRLAGSVLGRPYVRTPFDKRHTVKIQKRMAEYGCIRSRRHLRDGRCPSMA
jgi:hypothetical protein